MRTSQHLKCVATKLLPRDAIELSAIAEAHETTTFEIVRRLILRFLRERRALREKKVNPAPDSDVEAPRLNDRYGEETHRA